MYHLTDRVRKCSGLFVLLAIQLTLSSVAAAVLDTNEPTNGTKLHQRAKRAVDVDDLYGRISTEDLLQQIRNEPYIVQLIEGFVNTYNKMKENGEQNSPVVIKLAQFVRETLNMPNLNMVDQRILGQLLMLRDELPRSIKNAVFAQRVCFRNVENDEYLISPSQAYLYDLERRRVFTWIPGGRPRDNFGSWELTFQGNDVFIRNFRTRENMYAPANIYKYDSDRRRVFTWTQDWIQIGGSGLWKLEPEGDNVNIKSAAYPEYLYAAGDGFNHDNDRRSVYTWGPGDKISNGLWEIEDCT
ncbi:uncharacterized protein LOC129747272 [Uranotaenia lowii]|uniref:uncharacterized protein LOC129747272 n=1 Tax=Uranotaenia lowii TaxID=190385 RepID=UPI00247A1C64|nr:uncharacterized protein LOC129747272 [Uranotaenia lowii]